MPTKICVYAICKDEDKYVDQWFQNVAPADYIAVLDTGSQPKFYAYLQAIAEKINAQAGYQKCIIQQKVITPWRFDVARNESMRLIPEDADLCLCTDFDELLVSGWADVIRSRWNGESRVMYQYAWTHTENGMPAKIFTYDKCHANDHKHFWKYPVHECISIGAIEDDLDEIHRGLYINDIVPFLEHFPDPAKDRKAEYGELLKVRMREFPNEVFSYTYILSQKFWEGKYQEVVDFSLNEAIPAVWSRKYKDQASMPDILLYTGDAYRALGQFDKAQEYHRMAIATLPNARDGYLGLAWDLIYAGDCQGAIEQVMTGLRVGVKMSLWCEREFSWTYMPYVILSVAYHLLGAHRTGEDYKLCSKTFGAPENMIENILKDFVVHEGPGPVTTQEGEQK